MLDRAVRRCIYAAVLFGGAAPAASVLAGSVGAFRLAGLLYLGAALAVAPIVARQGLSAEAVRREWRPALGAVLFGGALGPVLLVAGLARSSAATSSLLLNTELVATAVIATLFFGEYLGRRMLTSVVCITAAGVLLSWQGGASLDAGALFVVAACACWGYDNCVSAKIEQLSPEAVVALKGVIAGSANLAIGLFVEPGSLAVREVVAALMIGALGYGASITLWVKGARDLGAARAQAIFAAAPFVGAAGAWVFLGDSVTPAQLGATALGIAGVAISLRSAHTHRHEHVPVVHDHEHSHDDVHHDHLHADGFRGEHSHPHHHAELTHSHAHVPDLHHRHRHGRRHTPRRRDRHPAENANFGVDFLH